MADTACNDYFPSVIEVAKPFTFKISKQGHAGAMVEDLR